MSKVSIQYARLGVPNVALTETDYETYTDEKCYHVVIKFEKLLSDQLNLFQRERSELLLPSGPWEPRGVSTAF
jgi:hypothetical protein